MFKIGDFSRLCRVPTSALRYYDELGLLRPSQVDTFSGYRYYTAEQLPRLNRILALKDLGLSLEQIKVVLDEPLAAEEIRGMLRLKQAEIEQRVSEEQARLLRVEARLKQIEQEGKMPAQDVVLKAIEAQHVLSIREVIAKPSDVGTLLTEVFTAVMPKGIQSVAPPIAIFHDEEFKANDLDVEIVVPVLPSVTQAIGLANDRAIRVRALPGLAQAACVIHEGTFDDITNSYSTIAQWISSSGYRIAGPSREVYLTAPDEHGKSMTEIQYPVEKV
jgi:DNA-binding transcriptional MerR regulator